MEPGHVGLVPAPHPSAPDAESSLDVGVMTQEEPTVTSMSPALLWSWKKLGLLMTSGVVLISGLASAATIIIETAQRNSSQPYNSPSNYSVQSLPSNKLRTSEQSLITNADHLDVNGQLRANNSLVLAPGTTPANPTAGELYYDKTTNQPYFYNGTDFVGLQPVKPQPNVSDINGKTGSISLGQGLVLNGNTLSVSSSLFNQDGTTSSGGVQSLQGLTGKVSLHAGHGISISGTTITNSGVTSLTSSDNSVTITNQGNGSYNLSVGSSGGGGGGSGVASLDSQTGVLSLANSSGNAGTITINNASTSQKGIAQFDSTNFTTSSGTVSLKSASVTSAQLANTTVAAAAYGSASSVATFTVNAQGQLTTAATTSIAIAASQVTSGQVAVTRGGTGIGSYTTGDLVYASGATTLSKLADVAAGSCLNSGGVGVAPTWGGCGAGGSGVSSLDTQTGVLSLANSTGSAGTITINNALADGVTKGIATFSASQFVSTTGDITIKAGGITGTEIASATVASSNLINTTVTANGYGDASHVVAFTVNAEGQLTAAANTSIAIAASQVTSGQLAVAQGGTGLNSYTIGDLLYASAGNTLSKLNDVAVGSCLVSGGIGAAPTWGSCSGTGGSGVTSLDSQVGVLSLSNSTSPSTGVITIDNALADGSTKGIASFSASQFVSTAGNITIKAGGITNTEIANASVTGSNIAAATVASSNLVNTTVAANSYGSASSAATFTVNAQGQLTAAAATPIAIAANQVTSGQLAVAQGGTGAGSFTQNGVVFGNATGVLGVTAAGSTGQCLVATTGSAPSWGSCGAGGSTLQADYTASTGGTTPEITEDSTRTTVDIQAYSGQAADLLDLRGFNAGGLGTVEFGVSPAGNTTVAGTLSVGGQSVFNASGILQSAALSGTYSNALTLSSSSNSIAGTWNGNTIGVNKGGTGIASFTAGSLLYASASTTISQIGIAGTSGECLNSNGSNPFWGSCGSGGVGGSGTSGQVAYFNGGSSLTSNSNLTYNGTTLTSASLSVGGSGISSSGSIVANGGISAQGISVFSGNLTVSSGSVSASTVSATGNLTSTSWQSGVMLQSGSGQVLSLYINSSNQTVVNSPTGVVFQSTGFNQGRISNAGNLTIAGTLTQNGSPDYDETIYASDDSAVGDVVMADPDNTERVVKSNGTYNASAVGIVTDGSGSVINHPQYYGSSPGIDDGLKGVPIALAGRVPVHVTNANGAIKPGDHLTTSNIPGYAMKATKPGPTIGIAYGSFDASTGTTLALVNISYYNPTDGESIQANDATLDSLTVTGSMNASSINVGNNLNVHGDLDITGSATIAQNLGIGGDLTVSGSTSVQNITIAGHIIATGSTPTGKAMAAAGTSANVSITGTDTSGKITITTGTGVAVGDLADITFARTFSASPNIVLTAGSTNAALLQYFVTSSGAGFSLNTPPNGNGLSDGTTYTFYYHAIQ